MRQKQGALTHNVQSEYYKNRGYRGSSHFVVVGQGASEAQAARMRGVPQARPQGGVLRVRAVRRGGALTFQAPHPGG